MKNITTALLTVVAALPVAMVRPVRGQEQPATQTAVERLRFHHVHLNSVDPAKWPGRASRESRNFESLTCCLTLICWLSQKRRPNDGLNGQTSESAWSMRFRREHGL